MSRKAQEQIEIIKAIGMVLISVMVVGGGLFFMYTKPGDSGLVSPMVGTVIAYYFLAANQNRTVRKTVNELLAGDALASTPQMKVQR